MDPDYKNISWDDCELFLGSLEAAADFGQAVFCRYCPLPLFCTFCPQFKCNNSQQEKGIVLGVLSCLELEEKIGMTL